MGKAGSFSRGSCVIEKSGSLKTPGIVLPVPSEGQDRCKTRRQNHDGCC